MLHLLQNLLFPSRRAQPQRLLALAALRRRIIAEALDLRGADADIAAYALEDRLRHLLDIERDPARQHVLAVGLLSVGRRDALDVLLDTLPDPLPAITLDAFALVLPLPARLRHGSDAGAIVNWFRKHYRRLKWDETNECFRLREPARFHTVLADRFANQYTLAHVRF